MLYAMMWLCLSNCAFTSDMQRYAALYVFHSVEECERVGKLLQQSPDTRLACVDENNIIRSK